MAVAQLKEGERLRGNTAAHRGRQSRVKPKRGWNTRTEREQRTRPGPRHTSQKIATALFNFRHGIDLQFIVSMPVTRPADGLFPRPGNFYRTRSVPLSTA